MCGALPGEEENWKRKIWVRRQGREIVLTVQFWPYKFEILWDSSVGNALDVDGHLELGPREWDF